MSILIYTNMYNYTYEGWGRAMWQVEFHQIPTQFTQMDYFKLMAKNNPKINKKTKYIFSFKHYRKIHFPPSFAWNKSHTL